MVAGSVWDTLKKGEQCLEKRAIFSPEPNNPILNGSTCG
jgi:hypothetical protein